MTDCITSGISLDHRLSYINARRNCKVFGTGRNVVHYVPSIKTLAKEVTQEAHTRREVGGISREKQNVFENFKERTNQLWPLNNVGKNRSLCNPLLRHEMMGCGWLAVILELEGVVLEDNPGEEKQAWLSLSQEEGKSPPPAFVLKRIEGMKNEQAISEVLCWSRDPIQMKRMACRKDEIYQTLNGGIYRARVRSIDFLEVLMKYKIPIALVSIRSREAAHNAIDDVGLREYFDVIVTGEDVYRGKPDPEMFVYAAELLGYVPERCIVFGSCNMAVEAAREGRMKCVAVAGKQRVYELGAADLVVSRLDEISVVDLKKLVAVEDEFDAPEVEMEKEEESDTYSCALSVGDDVFR